MKRDSVPALALVLGASELRLGLRPSGLALVQPWESWFEIPANCSQMDL